MSVQVLMVAALALAVAAILILSLLQGFKRLSMRRAVRIPERGAPPRWSTLHLEEVARIRARPKRLPRRAQGFRPWEAIEAGPDHANQTEKFPWRNGSAGSKP